MVLCAPCEQIMLIRLKQRKNFYLDLCPACRAQVRQAFQKRARQVKVAVTG